MWLYFTAPPYEQHLTSERPCDPVIGHPLYGSMEWRHEEQPGNGTYLIWKQARDVAGVLSLAVIAQFWH